MGIRHPDIVTAAILFVIGAVMLHLSYDIRVNPTISTFTPRFFPQLASVGIIVCAAGILVQALRAPPRPLPFLFNRTSLIVAALFCLYFMTFEEVDFRLGAWALTLACMAVLGARRPAELALVPLGTAFGVYALFRHGFEVVLPVWT